VNAPAKDFWSVVLYDLQTGQPFPGKGWFAILRLYGPTEAWFDKTWRPGEVEEVR